MKKTLIIGITLLIGIVAGYFFYQNFLSTGPSMANRAVDLKVNAEELFEAFETDEVKANQKYLNKVLEVHGKALALKQSDSGKYYLELETMGFGVVKCTMEDSFEPGAKEWSGEKVTIKGECLGYLLDVQIGEAILIE